MTRVFLELETFSGRGRHMPVAVYHSNILLAMALNYIMSAVFCMPAGFQWNS